MSYGIIRVQKFKKTAVCGIQIHDKREKESRTNPDIDKEKTPNNYTLQSCDNLIEEVQKRLQSLELKKAIRKDAVVMCQALITSDHEFFKDLDKEKQAQFFTDSFEFLQKKFSKYNILSATIHLDEKTPHMHVNFVPVIEGKLSAKELLTPNSLRELQTDFYNEVGKNFGLERGETRAEKNRHLETETYKLVTRQKKLQQLEQSLFYDKGKITAQDLEPKVTGKNLFLLDTKETPEQVAKRLEHYFVRPHILENKVLREEIKEKDKEILNLSNQNKLLSRKEKDFDSLYNDFEYLLDYRYLSKKSKERLLQIAKNLSIRDEYDRLTAGQPKGQENLIYGNFSNFLKNSKEQAKKQAEQEKKPLREKLFEDFEKIQKQKRDDEIKILNFNRKKLGKQEFKKEEDKIIQYTRTTSENFLKYLLEQSNQSKEFAQVIKDEEKKIKAQKQEQQKKEKQVYKAVGRGMSL